jgi:hypothetical protein
MSDKSAIPKLSTILFLLLAFLIFVGINAYFTRDYLKKYFAPTPLDNLVAGVPRSPYVSAKGTKLYVNGAEYRFTGFNAYHLAGLQGVNTGCGGSSENIEQFFSALEPGSVIRLWAFQKSMATNALSQELDWRGIDRVVNTAQLHNIRLILVLGDQSGTCDDGQWKDLAWYNSGYTQSAKNVSKNKSPLPYLEYVKAIVTRYKDSEAIAMWEPINEPEVSECKSAQGSECYNKQSCPDEAQAAKSLRTFFDTVGKTIKNIDKNHLVSSGVIGDGQCGASYEDYKYVHQSSGIDVASFHDYNRDNQPLPGDEWNGLKKRLEQMQSIGKPLIVGEVGMKAANNSDKCINLVQRRDKLKNKMDAQFTAGIAGFLPWDLTLGISEICNFDIVQADPTILMINSYLQTKYTLPSPAMSQSTQIYTFTPPSTPSSSIQSD